MAKACRCQKEEESHVLVANLEVNGLGVHLMFIRNQTNQNLVWLKGASSRPRELISSCKRLLSEGEGAARYAVLIDVGVGT